jgi:uncharacterized membrane protein (UPF0127 family)
MARIQKLHPRLSARTSITLSLFVIALVLAGSVMLYRTDTRGTVASVTKPSGPSFEHPLTIGTKTIMAAYAVTAIEQERGLSDTEALRDGQGMLFVFPSPTDAAFWMKDMRYSLDIIWIGEDKVVKDIHADLSPESYPAQFAPKEPVRYVLEVPAGFAKAHKIKIGTQTSF